MSAPSQYKSVFEYLAADIVGKNKKIGVDGSMLSTANIPQAIGKLFKLNKVYGPYTESQASKIKWKAYVPQDIREYSIEKINDARVNRLNTWKKFLETPKKTEEIINAPELVDKVKGNKSLKFVIWNAINSELKDNNRHIPVPFNARALSETITGFEKIEPKDRAVRCAAPSFIDIYTHRLRDNLLEEKGLSENKNAWVKIPALKKDIAKKDKNISDLEILSCRNWCTRSSVDKAKAALEDGNFYIYLERDKNNLWNPLIGMASHENKIDQIQGIENNNVIPLNQLDNVKNFIKENGLKCQTAIVDEGPKAYPEILIGEKISEFNKKSGKSFEKTLKENDTNIIWEFLNKKAKQIPDGTIEIENYKPSLLLEEKKGISVPYTMMGINEDSLLENVSKIDGDLILANKNNLFNSSITKFPQKLESVNGKIVCTKEQFEAFGKDFERVAKNPKNIVVY